MKARRIAVVVAHGQPQSSRGPVETRFATGLFLARMEYARRLTDADELFIATRAGLFRAGDEPAEGEWVMRLGSYYDWSILVHAELVQRTSAGDRVVVVGHEFGAESWLDCLRLMGRVPSFLFDGFNDSTELAAILAALGQQLLLPRGCR